MEKKDTKISWLWKVSVVLLLLLMVAIYFFFFSTREIICESLVENISIFNASHPIIYQGDILLIAVEERTDNLATNMQIIKIDTENLKSSYEIIDKTVDDIYYNMFIAQDYLYVVGRHTLRKYDPSHNYSLVKIKDYSPEFEFYLPKGSDDFVFQKYALISSMFNEESSLNIIDLDTLDIVWKEAPFANSPLVISKNRAYFVSADNMYSIEINGKNSKLSKKKISIPNEVQQFAKPFLKDNRLYLESTMHYESYYFIIKDGEEFDESNNTEKVKKFKDSEFCCPLIHDSILYYGTYQTIHAIDMDKKEEIGKYDVSPRSSIVWYKNKIYFLERAGKLYKWDVINKQKPTFIKLALPPSGKEGCFSYLLQKKELLYAIFSYPGMKKAKIFLVKLE